MHTNIIPSTRDPVDRCARERRLNQRAHVFWVYGLSGAGKTTLGRGLERTLFDLGFATAYLDGDEIRSGLNFNLGYSLDARTENVRRAAHAGRLLLDAGLVVVAAFMTPTAAMRELARSIIGGTDFDEIFLDCPASECERRDVKGLYAQARKGMLRDLPGKGFVFEVPDAPDLQLNTETQTYSHCLDLLVSHALTRIGRGIAARIELDEIACTLPR